MNDHKSVDKSLDELSKRFPYVDAFARPQQFAPIMDLRGLRGVGPRLADPAMDTMHLNPYPAYEDMKLKTP